ncbi:uncharacterized protein B0J16DRAFT_188349 [Fusarium flagelliforme]|uniref:uncharacterized protein n=1 Tax=Fusarium flagelliforme TaxID=2675880 RepID=UPI001E8CDDED|nr:uncharacterized protein B0J16DRAFT_188349 [Fusarium flagelliforme]KAH7173257.1 hypothetical protein B0J16DRAFT_188349 [Fusarium flagelliforme]
MRKSHTEPRWHCWYCDAATPFFSAEELQKHLERNHQREVTDSLRKTVMKHSLVYDQHALQYCPFCDCFPEEIEDRYADRNADEAQEALEQHVKGHLLSLSLIPASVEIAEDDVVTQGFRERDRLLAPVEVADEDAIPQGFRERKREHGKTRIFSPNSSTGNPRKKPRRSDPNGVRFACPYHKKNWARYSSGPCNGKGFENIDRLKTHLKDYHDLSEHWRRCHICKKRFLRDQLDTHSPCERRDEWDDYEDGYDVDQAQDLKKDETRTRKNPPESCWKAIFRVLFPNWPADHDTPSPYQAKTGSTDYTDAIHQHRNGVMGDHTMSQLGDCQSNDERRQVLEPFFRELERNLVYTQMTTGHLPPRPVSAQPTIVVNTQPPQYQLPPVPQLAYNYGHGRRLQLPTPALSSSDANSHRHLQSVDPSDTFTDWTEFSDQMSIGLDSLGSYQAMNSSNTLPQFNTERTITVAQQPMGNTSHNPVPDFAAGNEETALDDWTTFLNGPQHQPQSVGGYLVQDDLKQEDYDENEMPSMAP